MLTTKLISYWKITVNRYSLALPALLLSTLFLSACATPPTSLKLTAQLDEAITINKIEREQTWVLNSDDFRTARYLIAISSGDEVATLINESASSRILIENSLRTHWVKQGIQFTDKSSENYEIKVQLIKLLAEVEQGTVSHESDINVILKIQLSSDKTTFSKTFRSHYEQKAPFRADIEKLTTQLNMQLSQLLDQVVQDPEVNAKLLQL
ncbi:MAG: hypothetical protein GY787_13990 [Alteromonadales bacterium]|nr:hypothetical protein [Alteromonadales bacterium]